MIPKSLLLLHFLRDSGSEGVLGVGKNLVSLASLDLGTALRFAFLLHLHRLRKEDLGSLDPRLVDSAQPGTHHLESLEAVEGSQESEGYSAACAGLGPSLAAAGAAEGQPAPAAWPG